MHSYRTHQQHFVRRTAGLAFFVASIAVVVGVGCQKADESTPNAAATLGAAITRAATTQPTEKLDLATLTDFEWDRLYVFGPQTKKTEIASALGFEWAGVGKTTISRSEDVALLLFTRDKKVVGWLEYPRVKADFSFVSSSRGYTRDEAKFAIRSQALWPVVAQSRASMTP